MTTPKSIVRLRGSIQQYDWGKPASSSLAAKLAPEAIGHDYKIEQDKCYAEVWMGTHKNGPASLFDSPETSLHSLISSDPTHFLGPDLVAKWPHTTDIPFLFKILSIQKALPLQAHPDKSLGAALHAQDPAQFVDANHKPEIAVALGPFRGFCGFRPLDAIAQSLRDVPELAQAVGDSALVDAFVRAPSKDALKSVYSALLQRGKDNVEAMKGHVQTMLNRCVVMGAMSDRPVFTELLMQVNEQYPGDVGVLATTFFMNLVSLDKGEAIYIGADEVHAYLEGDIIECMAISDNVVNSAFVPPAERDIKLFTDMLTYTSRPAQHWALQRTPCDLSARGRTSAFSPPLEEFDVLWTTLEKGQGEELKKAKGPTIGIVTQGKVSIATQAGEDLELSVGGVVFVAAGQELSVTLKDGDMGEVWWATYSA